jgi:hypothetical protein
MPIDEVLGAGLEAGAEVAGAIAESAVMFGGGGGGSNNDKENNTGCFIMIIFAVLIVGGIIAFTVINKPEPDPLEVTKEILNTYPENGTPDGWGNPIKVTEDKGLVLWDTWTFTSAGPDGAMDTGDDMIKKRRIRR